VDVECHPSLPLVLAARHDGASGGKGRVQVFRVGARAPMHGALHGALHGATGRIQGQQHQRGQGQLQWQQRREQRQGRRGVREGRGDAARGDVRARGAGSQEAPLEATLTARVVAECPLMRHQGSRVCPLMIGAVRWQPKQHQEQHREQHRERAGQRQSGTGRAVGSVGDDTVGDDTMGSDGGSGECGERILFLVVGMGGAGRCGSTGAGAAGEVQVCEVGSENDDLGLSREGSAAADGETSHSTGVTISVRMSYMLNYEGTMWTAEWAPSHHRPHPPKHHHRQMHMPHSTQRTVITGRISTGSSEIGSHSGVARMGSRSHGGSRGQESAALPSAALSSRPSASRWLPSQLVDVETGRVMAAMPRAVGADVSTAGKGGRMRCGGLDVFAQAFCERGEVLLSGCRDGSVWEWDTRAAVSMHMQRVEASTGSRTALGRGRAGGLINSRKGILSNTSTSSAASLTWRPSPACTFSVCCLQVLSNGHHVIASCQDGSLRMIDRRTRMAIADETTGGKTRPRESQYVAASTVHGAASAVHSAAGVVAEYRGGANILRRFRVALDPTETVLLAPRLGSTGSAVMGWSLQHGRAGKLGTNQHPLQQQQQQLWPDPSAYANAVGCWYQPSRVPACLVCAATPNGLELHGV
jgi:hypothetical protein